MFPTSFINHRRKENVGSVVFKFAESSSSSTVDFSRENNERLKVFLSRASGGTWSLVVTYTGHICWSLCWSLFTNDFLFLASFVARTRFKRRGTMGYDPNDPEDIVAAGIEDVDEALVMVLSAFDCEEIRDDIQCCREIQYAPLNSRVNPIIK